MILPVENSGTFSGTHNLIHNYCDVMYRCVSLWNLHVNESISSFDLPTYTVGSWQLATANTHIWLLFNLVWGIHLMMTLLGNRIFCNVSFVCFSTKYIMCWWENTKRLKLINAILVLSKSCWCRELHRADTWSLHYVLYLFTISTLCMRVLQWKNQITLMKNNNDLRMK